MLLQTFHNADIQLNCDCAWLFGSLFTPTTLLQSHMSNYLHAGVSTYGYDSFCLTTAINTGVRDQNCSSESVTDDRYGKRFSMIFCTHGGRGDFKGRRRGRKKGARRKVGFHTRRCSGSRNEKARKFPPMVTMGSACAADGLGFLHGGSR